MQIHRFRWQNQGSMTRILLTFQTGGLHKNGFSDLWEPPKIVHRILWACVSFFRKEGLKLWSDSQCGTYSFKCLRVTHSPPGYQWQMIVWNLPYKLRWFHWSSKPHTLAILGGIDECMFSRSKKTHVCATLLASGRLGLILESSVSSGRGTREHDQGTEGPRNSVRWERGEGIEGLLLEEENS